jgi:hypothetical protein
MSKIENALTNPIFQWKRIDWKVLETHGMDYTFDFLQKTYISARSGMDAGFVRSSTRQLSKVVKLLRRGQISAVSSSIEILWHYSD